LGRLALLLGAFLLGPGDARRRLGGRAGFLAADGRARLGRGLARAVVLGRFARGRGGRSGFGLPGPHGLFLGAAGGFLGGALALVLVALARLDQGLGAGIHLLGGQAALRRAGASL